MIVWVITMQRPLRTSESAARFHVAFMKPEAITFAPGDTALSRITPPWIAVAHDHPRPRAASSVGTMAHAEPEFDPQCARRRRRGAPLGGRLDSAAATP